MTVARSVADVLNDHVVFEVECIESSATWLAHPPAVGAVVMQIARDCLRMPSHFRPHVLPGAGDRVEGQWVSATQLPILEPGMTEERLQDILEKSAEARRRAQA